MSIDFFRADVHDGSNPPRTMWTGRFDWNDAEHLLHDPIGFFARQRIPMKFGQELQNITLLYTRTEDEGPGDLIIEGMDDTHVIQLRVRNWATDAGDDGKAIHLSQDVPLTIQTRQDVKTGRFASTATAHLHFTEEIEMSLQDKAEQISRMIRHPHLLLNALRRQTESRKYKTFINHVSKNPDETPVSFVAMRPEVVLVEWNLAARLSLACSRIQLNVVSSDNKTLALSGCGLMFQTYPSATAAHSGHIASSGGHSEHSSEQSQSYSHSGQSIHATEHSQPYPDTEQDAQPGHTHGH